MNSPIHFIGLDLGQAADPSALAVARRTYPEGRLPHFDCVALKRWPLGTSYVVIVKEVREILARPVLAGSRLAIDASGVGRPVLDVFRQAKLPAPLFPVVITAGQRESRVNGIYHIAKVVLVNGVQVALQQRRLQFAEKIPETGVLVAELQNYRMKITPALNETYNAREGANDDLLLALALAIWAGERFRQEEGNGVPIVHGHTEVPTPGYPLPLAAWASRPFRLGRWASGWDG